MKHINLPSPSMKKDKNMDGSMKNDIPSMKTDKNVDGSMKLNCAPKVGHNKFKHERIKVSN
jgi:hypothetical protein